MAKDHGPSVKDDELYEALRKQGASEQKAARTLRHRGGTLDQRTKSDLLEEAREIGIVGRSRMTKAELIKAIRAE